ncbi:DUF3226 domain-containing protein [Lewinella cohaerens]|uniref:DUF3226 domain-containing protein n=1 Tax=Lewinella cohaerens TaxID=70995 RepID=UPI00037ED723|nr:DUF3226 domain-containing protein [Lewinella cohaerens]
MNEFTQVISFFCEGPHDVAFIYKMLKIIGYKSYDACKIGDLPIPFNQLILNEVKKYDIENLNIIEVRRGFLPARILHKEGKCIFLYSLGGDSKRAIRQSMLSDLLSFIPEEGEIPRLPQDTSLSVIYLFDADEVGVQSRLRTINNEVNAKLANSRLTFANNGEFHTVNQMNFGAYVFTGEDDETGSLESILVPLMRQENEVIFEDAQSFIDTHYDEMRLFPLKIRINEDEIIEERSERGRDKYKFYPSKSLIGVTGQLQCSGKSNVVCIGDTDFLTKDKLTNTRKSLEILDFLKRI